MSFVSIAAYRPDDASLSGAFSVYIKNLFVGQNSYLPVPSLVRRGEPITEEIYGAISVHNLQGKSRVFVGTKNKIFMIEGNNWEDVTNTECSYSACNEAPWSFACFGNYVVAVNANTPPQIFELDKCNKFRNMRGNPPLAAEVKVWGDFLCLLRLTDNLNRVHWSGLNNIEWWTPGQHSCDYQDFPEGGAVQNSSESANPIIFLENAIYYGEFLPGSDVIFSFRKLQDVQGTSFPKSVAVQGQQIFYANHKGFFQIDNTGQNISIGYGSIDTSFTKELSSDTNIKAGIDPINSRVYWVIDKPASEGIVYVYDWIEQAWSRIEANLKFILPMHKLGMSLEDLDQICDNINEFKYSFDDPRWEGGMPILAAIDNAGYLCSFSGKPMEASIETQEFFLTDGTIQKVARIHPVVDTNHCKVSIGRRDNPAEVVNWTQPMVMGSYNHNIAANVRGRYIRFKIELLAEADWSVLRGIDVDFIKAGIN